MTPNKEHSSVNLKKERLSQQTRDSKIQTNIRKE